MSERDTTVFDNGDILELLACPKCHAALCNVAQPAGFGCQACQLLYPLEDGLPNMLISEARPWPDSGGAPATA